MDVLGPCLKYVYIFRPSIDEAKALSGKDDLDDIADCFFDSGVKQVAIKNGKHGCYLRESREAKAVFLETYKDEKVVDTTGAGDSFCAGFITGLAKGLSFKMCIRDRVNTILTLSNLREALTRMLQLCIARIKAENLWAVLQILLVTRIVLTNMDIQVITLHACPTD